MVLCVLATAFSFIACFNQRTANVWACARPRSSVASSIISVFRHGFMEGLKCSGFGIFFAEPLLSRLCFIFIPPHCSVCKAQSRHGGVRMALAIFPPSSDKARMRSERRLCVSECRHGGGWRGLAGVGGFVTLLCYWDLLVAVGGRGKPVKQR